MESCALGINLNSVEHEQIAGDRREHAPETYYRSRGVFVGSAPLAYRAEGLGNPRAVVESTAC